jgi:4-amino-4-deoxy-L-arabinose transferase-like glycosyltransferase
LLGVPRSAQSLVFIALLTFFLGLGRQAITDSDEAFYAEAAREMVETGDWLTPRFNYEDRWQKPVLYYWLTAATYLVTGPTELVARLWSALSGLGLVLLVWLAAQRITNRSDVAWLAGAITATCYGYLVMARVALPDLPLAFFITLGIWAALERRWPLAGGAAGLGFLMKGPVALVIPGLVLLPIWWRERTFRTLGVGNLAVAALVFAVAGLPWYAAMWMEHGGAYLQSFFVADNFERFATDRFNEPRAFWFYLPIVIGGLIPWSTYLVALPLRSLRAVLTGALRLTDEQWRLLLWASIPLVFYTISVGKQPRYILPVLPPLAILLASSILERTSEWHSVNGLRRRPRPNGVVVTGCVLSGLFLLSLAVLLYRAQPLFVGVGRLNTLFAAAVIAIGGVAVIIVSLAGGWRSAPGVLALATAMSYAVLPYGVLAASRDSTVVQMAQHVRDARAADDRALATYRVFVRNLVFYTGLKHQDIIHDEHLNDWLTKNPRALIVMTQKEADRLAAGGLRLERVAALTYFNEGSLKVRTLLWPDPAVDLETVVLVKVDRPTTASQD